MSKLPVISDEAGCVEHHKADREHLSLEERSKLPQCKDCPTIAANSGYEEVMASSLQELIARQKPTVHKVPRQTAKTKAYVFEHVGHAGEVKQFQVNPDGYFRCENFSAKDTLDGFGTVIEAAFVGCRLQRVGSTKRLTADVMRGIRAGEISPKWDTCQPAFSLYLQVRFESNCVFRAELQGKEVV